MKITSSLIDKLIRLRSGESLPSSALRGEWVEELLSDGVFISRSHGSRSSIIAASPETLEQSLRHTDERLGNLDKMKETLDTESTRSGQAAETGNSKLVTTRSCPGFPVNSYEPITCSLSGKELVVNPQEGTFLFIADWHSFAIPDDVTVVNIENMENFRLIRRQQSLFASALAGKRLLFVSRYPQSSDLRTWLQTPKSVRPLRRFRPRRHPYLPYRISKTPRHTRLFPHSARHRAAHKAWFGREIQRPIPKILPPHLQYPATTATDRYAPQISPLLRPGRIYRE